MKRPSGEYLGSLSEAGLSPVMSISFEVLAQYCPAGWGQQTFAGAPALTGWVPPSTLLSPAHAAAMGWLQGVASAFAGLMLAAGVAVMIQTAGVGRSNEEPITRWIDEVIQADMFVTAGTMTINGGVFTNNLSSSVTAGAGTTLNITPTTSLTEIFH